MSLKVVIKKLQPFLWWSYTQIYTKNNFHFEAPEVALNIKMLWKICNEKIKIPKAYKFKCIEKTTYRLHSCIKKINVYRQVLGTRAEKTSSETKTIHLRLCWRFRFGTSFSTDKNHNFHFLVRKWCQTFKHSIPTTAWPTEVNPEDDTADKSVFLCHMNEINFPLKIQKSML